MATGLLGEGKVALVFQDQLFLAEKRWLMPSHGRLPETKSSVGGLPGPSRDSRGEGMGLRATSG